MAVRDVAQRFEEARRVEMLEGVTFSGGEPMQQAEALLNLMDAIREEASSVSFGVFTGYTEAELAAGQYLTRPKATQECKQDLWRDSKTARTLPLWAVTTKHSRRRSRYGRAEIKG